MQQAEIAPIITLTFVKVKTAHISRLASKYIFPGEDEIVQILRRTTSNVNITVEKVTNAATLNQMRQLFLQGIIGVLLS